MRETPPVKRTCVFGVVGVRGLKENFDPIERRNDSFCLKNLCGQRYSVSDTLAGTYDAAGDASSESRADDEVERLLVRRWRSIGIHARQSRLIQETCIVMCKVRR